jgi:hypothetical protein
VLPSSVVLQQLLVVAVELVVDEQGQEFLVLGMLDFALEFQRVVLLVLVGAMER